MADPVELVILDDAKAALALVTKANGYSVDLVNVLGWRVPAHVERPAASVVLGKSVVIGEGPLPYYSKQVPLLIQAEIESLHDTADDDSEPDKVGWRLVADLHKALHVDITRGGVAVDTNLIGAEVFADWPAAPIVTVEVELRVDFRTERDDPTAAR